MLYYISKVKKKHFKKFIKTKRMFVILLMSHVAIFIVMSVFGFWMYSENEANSQNSLKEYRISYVEQVGSNIDDFCLKLDTLSRRMKYMPLVDSAIQGAEKNIEFSDYANLLHSITDLNNEYDCIVDAYIYIPESNMIYSNSAIVDAEIFFNKIRKYRNYDYPGWKNKFLTGLYANKFFPMEVVDKYGLETTNVVTYSNTYLKKGEIQPAAYFNVIIDVDKLFTSMNGIEPADNIKAYMVYDSEADVIFKSGNDVPDVELVKKHLNEGVNYAELNNDKSVSYAFSNRENWKYAIVTEGVPFLENIFNSRIKLKFILLLNIIIGISLSVLSVIYNYKPIKNMVVDIAQIVHDGIENENIETGELEFVKMMFSEQQKRMRKVDDIVVKQKQTIKENVIRNILFTQENMDDINIHEDAFVYNKLMGFDAEMYGVAVLQLREYKSHKVMDDTKLIEYAVSNIILNMLMNTYNLNIVSIKSGKLALVVNLSRENIDAWFENMQFIGEYINPVMISEFGIEFFVGVGEVYDNRNKISTSFKEALDALDFQIYNNDKNVTIYKDLIKNQREYYYYPGDTNLTILNLISLGDFNQVKMILEDIEKANSKKELDSQAKDKLNLELVKLYKEVSVAYDIEPVFITDEQIKGNTSELIKIIKKEYRLLCGSPESTKSEKTEKLVEEIKEYISDNFSDNNLSANMISDQFGITRQYLSTIFHNITGEKLSEFITTVRLDEAKKLLGQRVLSVSQIAQEVGFTNDIALIRAFKKIEGVTPGYYREKMI